jgi:hypothetical protein
VIGYDAQSLARVSVYNDMPEGEAGGIWMSGQGLAADDAGNLYLSTANGSVGTASDPRDQVNRSDSFLKLSTAGGNLSVASWFTPVNWPEIELYDADLGSAGILLIPGTSLACSGGKIGTAYVVNRDQMGGLSNDPNSDTNIV